MLNTEHGNGLSQAAGLLFQRGSGSGGFFHKRGVLLRHTIHLGNGQTNLINTAALFIRSRGDFTHDIGHAGYRIDDLIHGFTGAFNQR